MFLDEEGMELFLDVLNTFPGEAAIETKILGLLNNIAEVHESGFFDRQSTLALGSVAALLSSCGSFH